MGSESINTLTIAGFDPCGGAGVLADIKTFEACGVNGMGVCSAITYQNESEVKGVDWMSVEQISNQISGLFDLYQFQTVKIGIIKDMEVLEKVCSLLLNYNPEIKIIWDPILKSSSEFKFQDELDSEKLKEVLSKMYLITPNIIEYGQLFGPSVVPYDMIKNSNGSLNLLLKGGHSEDSSRNDLLITSSGRYVYEGKPYHGKEKHGSGCVLSSAIAAYLSLTGDLNLACDKAKKYIHKFLLSTDTLLGKHYYEKA